MRVFVGASDYLYKVHLIMHKNTRGTHQVRLASKNETRNTGWLYFFRRLRTSGGGVGKGTVL